jgi:hypothetical protein
MEAESELACVVRGCVGFTNCLSGADLHNDDHARADVVQRERQRMSQGTIGDTVLVNGHPSATSDPAECGDGNGSLSADCGSLSASVRFWLSQEFDFDFRDHHQQRTRHTCRRAPSPATSPFPVHPVRKTVLCIHNG